MRNSLAEEVAWAVDCWAAAHPETTIGDIRHAFEHICRLLDDAIPDQRDERFGENVVPFVR